MTDLPIQARPPAVLVDKLPAEPVQAKLCLRDCA